LQTVPGLGSHKFLVDVVADLTKLTAAFKARFGKDIILTDAYRTYNGQVTTKNKWIARGEPKKAATPGTSNHGWGLAFDFDHKDESYDRGPATGFDSIVYKWLFQNAPTYNFHNPSWAQRGRKNAEAWHFESTKINTYYGTVEQTDGD
jgi:LAS superfamily LD-carboxypeptidase LdcB